jgi:glycosyltransferase involved in cell wall biosynthesis
MIYKHNNILFITHSYNSFQKESINSLSGYFNHCSVLVRSNPIAEISRYINIPYLSRYKIDYKIDLTDTPVNVKVWPTPILYAPIDSQYKKLGDKHFKAAENAIQKHNINFDIIHSHFSWSAGYAGAKLKEKYNVPFIVTAHGYDIYSLPFKDEEWKSKIEYVLRSADHIITVSKSNQECIKRLDVNTPVTVLPNGYRPDMFHPADAIQCRDKLGLSHDKKIIVTVGNLVEIKGHKYLIEAMKEVVKHRTDVVCYIVGGGGLQNKLQKQIDDSNLAEHVKLSGAKPHSEIPLWMNACDVFVLPSLNEGNPTVMFECLGCGKPFVGTKVGGVPEIINSDDYGLLVEPGDSQALADKIVFALDKDWDEGKIIKYSSRFTWEEITSKIIEIYDMIAKDEK